MKKLLHFHKDMFIASMDPGCYTPLILLSPATFLQHTWQTHSHLGKTRLQLCCCVVTCTACHSDHVLLSIILFKALSLFFSSPLSLYTATVFMFKALLVLSQSHPSSLSGHSGVNYHLQPALKLDSITHYLCLPPKKASLFFLQQCPIGT